MGRDTYGYINGYASADAVLEIIRGVFDKDAESFVERRKFGLISDISNIADEYTVNPHSQDDMYEYVDYGFISFKYEGHARMLFYVYDNVRIPACIRCRHAKSQETTSLSMRMSHSGIWIIRTLMERLGGGWLEENDEDEFSEPYWVDGKCPAGLDGEPAFMTVSDIRRLLGGNVVVVRDHKHYSAPKVLQG